MRPFLIRRYVAAFVKGIWGEVTDRVVEGLALACGLLSVLIKSGFSWNKFVEGRLENIAIGAFTLSALVI